MVVGRDDGREGLDDKRIRVDLGHFLLEDN